MIVIIHVTALIVSKIYDNTGYTNYDNFNNIDNNDNDSDNNVDVK